MPSELNLQRPTNASAMDVMAAAAHTLRQGVSGAVATVARIHGSTPSTPGQKLFLGRDGTCIGSVGGGAIEREVLLRLESLTEARMETFRLGAELGMCCGGQVDVFMEPLQAPDDVLIVGAGHVAQALVALLPRIGFRVVLVDVREAFATSVAGVESVCGEPSEAAHRVGPHACVLVMTHDHTLDQEAIEWALRAKYPFVGGIGSRAKAERTRQRLEAKGFTPTDLERIAMPLGLAIGARAPDEIAVAVAAQLIERRQNLHNIREKTAFSK